MTRRTGVTLLETLAALVLLALLSMVALNWVSLVSSRQESVVSQSRWYRAGHRVLEQISVDILELDRLDRGTAATRARVSVDGGSLRVRTREYGEAVLVAYTLDDQGELRREVSGFSNQGSALPLIGTVAVFESSIRKQGGAQGSWVLHVEISNDAGRRITRAYPLEERDIR